MKLTVRWVIFSLIMLLVAITLLLAIITESSSLWLTIPTIFLAALGVVGTFSQWLFPDLIGGSKQSPISDTTKQSPAVDNIFIDPYQRQKFEEQKHKQINKRREKNVRKDIDLLSQEVLLLDYL